MLRLMARCCWVLLVASASLAIAQTVTVRSGNGSVGGRDSSVTFLLGPANTDFSSSFTQADFSSAQHGPAAFIIPPNPLWVPGLSADPNAKWIGTSSSSSSVQGNTALYAISFTIPSVFSSATLTLNYAVDDGLGTTQPGLFLNGQAVCENLIATTNQFVQEHTLTCTGISALLQVGTNWLYFDDVNAAGPAGLLFSATITTSDLPVPPTISVGSNPYGITFDGANIWVSNSGVIAAGANRNSVTKLRAIDGVTLGTYAVGSAPCGVVFDGSNIWVANNGSGTVSKLRASDGAVLGTFSITGTNPFAMAFDGSNIWVTSVNGTVTGHVTELRASDGATLGVFAVGNSPSGVAFDGANIWVENYFSNNVTKLRASDGSNLGTFSVGNLPRGVIFDGTNIWVSKQR
jgi:hypothetical protein